MSAAKAKHERPYALLQSLSISKWKWEYISMNFMVKLSRVKGAFNLLWVIVDHLTKSTHFILVKDNTSFDN